MNRRWICVWMDLFPFFDHAQLGLKLALISPRFNALVDIHFDGKSEFTIWRPIEIRKDTDAEVPKLFVFIDEANSVPFPLLDRPLPSKIRFHDAMMDSRRNCVAVMILRQRQKLLNGSTISKRNFSVPRFLRAANKIQFFVHTQPTSMVLFELANDRTQEKLTLTKASNYEGINRWIMKRCPIGETAAIQWEDEYLADWNNIDFWPSNCCIGPLSPPPAEEGQSSEKGASSDN